MKLNQIKLSTLLLGCSIATNSANWPDKIRSVQLVGSHGWSRLQFTCDESGLHVKLPEQFDGKTAFALKIR